jgi:hypothetical protein
VTAPTAREPLILLGLTARAGSGKDTAADYLCQRYGFVRAGFADAPRNMLEALLEHVGVDHAWLFEPTLKERSIPVLGTSYRRTMQTLGTEWGRDMLDWDLWVRVLDAHLGLTADRPVHDRIVITDVRFPNEAAWLHEQGGHLVRLVREQTAPVHPHISEQYTDKLAADSAIVNNSPTIAGLHSLLDGLMAQLRCEEREPLFHEG